MADTTNITNSSNSVKSSIDQLSSNMKRLVTIQLAQLSKDSAEYADNMDSAYNTQKKLFDLETKHIKQLKEESKIEEERIRIEEKLAKLDKASIASDKAKEQIEKRILELKNKHLESEEDLRKEINKLRKEGLDIDEDDIDSQEELVKYLENRKGILARNVEITKLQSVELRKQIDYYKKHSALAGYIGKKWQDVKKATSSLPKEAFKKLESATRGWISQLAGFYTFGSVLERTKESFRFYRESMWGLGVSLRGANDDLLRIKDNIGAVDQAFKNARVTAAKFGMDTDRVRETMYQLSNKVTFLRKELESGRLVNRFDIDKLEGATEAVTVFARTMRMDVSEAIDMYSESIRKFGLSSKQAFKQMSNLQKSTIAFNTILVDSFNDAKKGFSDFENVAVFADEIGRAMLELQQGTRYWVQDLQMMNTQFNTHINLLIKQGKSQKEALALAKNFQKMLTEPTSQLTKYNVGKELRKDYLKAIESVGPEATKQQKIEAGALALGLATKNEKGQIEYLSKEAENKAESAYWFIEERNKHGRGRDVELTQANYLQEIAAMTSKGMEKSLEYNARFAGAHDATVALGQGIGENLDQTIEITRLMEDLKKNGLDSMADTKEAIRILKSREIDKKYGGLTEDGKATKELMDSFKKSKEGAEWQKAKLEGKTNLTEEQAALKFREDKITAEMKEVEKLLKNETKINEETGKAITSDKGLETNTVDNWRAKILEKVDSINSRLLLATAFMVGGGVLNSLGGLGNLIGGFKSFKAGKMMLEGANAMPKTTPKLPTKVPPNVTGSVGNATSKMNWQTFRNQHMDVNRAEAKRLFNQYNKAPIDKSAEKALAKVSETVAKSTSNVTKSVTAVEKSSKAVSTLSKAGLGSKVLSKAGPLGLLATAGIAGYQLSQGDTKGVARTGASTAGAVIGGALGSLAGPVGTVIGSTAGSFIGDFIADSLIGEDAFDKKATFEDFSRVTNSLGLLPENVDKAIEEYASQVQGLSEDSIKDMKESLKEQYKKTYIESQKANTKNPEAILLRKKLEYGNAKQAELTQAQLQQEKEAYEQLDELGKIITNQENLFKLHDKWFNFQVENEVRRLVSDKSLSDKEKKSMLKNMGKGSATGMIQQTRDASGVVTFKVKGNDVVTATGVGMFD